MDFMNLTKYRKFKSENIEFTHYAFCRYRMKSITDFSQTVFVYNIFTSLLVLFSNTSNSNINEFFYIALGLAMLIFSWFAMKKSKYFSLLMIIFYIINMVLVNLPLGIIGTLLYIISTLNAFELDIIKSMEGYPFFHRRFTETTNEYEPIHDMNDKGSYMDNLTRKTALGQPEEPAEIIEDENEKQILLEDLPKISEYLGDEESSDYDKVYNLPSIEDISLKPTGEELYTTPNAKISLKKKTDKK